MNNSRLQFSFLCIYMLCAAGIITFADGWWDTTGNEFITTFMQNYKASYGPASFQLMIRASESSAFASVKVYNTDFEVILSLQQYQTMNVQIPASAELSGSSNFNSKTVVITSTQPVSVFSINYKPYTADSSVIFPLQVLGTEYYVFTPLGRYGSPQFAVTNSNHTNNVLITLTGSVTYNGNYYQSGDTISLNLSPFETVQLQSAASLSGTRIQSQYPVAVLSGNNCYTYHTYCDIVFEQLLPVKEWGTESVISSLPGRNFEDTITIIASQTTDIFTNSGDKSNKIVLHEGGILSLSLPPTSFLEINATNGIMVIFTFTGGMLYNIESDPFIMNVIPLEIFSDSYILHTQNNFANFIHIIAKESVKHDILLDDQPLPNDLIWNSISTTEYVWADIPIEGTSTAHTVKNCSACGVYICGAEYGISLGTIALPVKIVNPVENLKASVFKGASVNVTWSSPTKGEVGYYYVQLIGSPSQNAIVTKENAVFTGLMPPNTYTVIVEAVDKYKITKSIPKSTTFFCSIPTNWCLSRPSKKCCPKADTSCRSIDRKCFCDEKCKVYGNCCDDYSMLCKGTP
ncbi:IgGFc-binding protein-like [Protopterus annectens]|uniref:IgGFc-binding protein-like n=1 Tax=Protopterus annectens TaxID=7888 RepID=UPI001CFC38BF|nr:IgGFc-binding protein-like [Protopterus annectens]